MCSSEEALRGVSNSMPRMGSVPQSQESPTSVSPNVVQMSPKLTQGPEVSQTQGVGPCSQMCGEIGSPMQAQGPGLSQTQDVDQCTGTNSESGARSTDHFMASSSTPPTESDHYLPSSDLGLPIFSDSIDSTESVQSTAYSDKGVELNPGSGFCASGFKKEGLRRRRESKVNVMSLI
ncbi:hypothetical protein V6N12_055515 [Hibiscus sabdariffa]|uniref:Uncharacterized protein n=1 Tax=Hibiscus sabdariffa TaxID=183260 RepID=A0ABR2BTX0_9ROSI